MRCAGLVYGLPDVSRHPAHQRRSLEGGAAPRHAAEQLGLMDISYRYAVNEGSLGALQITAAMPWPLNLHGIPRMSCDRPSEVGYGGSLGWEAPGGVARSRRDARPRVGTWACRAWEEEQGRCPARPARPCREVRPRHPEGGDEAACVFARDIVSPDGRLGSCVAYLLLVRGASVGSLGWWLNLAYCVFLLRNEVLLWPL